MLYLVIKMFHILAVVMFLGNITTGILWKEHADRTRDPRVILATLEGLIRSDRWFTIPGVFGIAFFGVLAAILGHYPILRTGWIFWAIVLFVLSGFAFGSRVAPLQAKMARLAKSGVESGSFDWDAYHRLSRDWAVWGAVALLAPLGALALMVLKPPLPGL